MAPEKSSPEGEIWAVAGGKGGTGKTFLACCLGVCLAQKNFPVTLVDFDFGGANLHSFLGLSMPPRTLTRFFDSKTSLEELLLPTGIDNMTLISGNIDSLASQSIRFTQKLKLFRQIARLHARYVIIDLGGGCHSHTLDTFLMADKRIAVLLPEVTAVENMYHFIKNALYRKLQATFKGHGFREIAREVWQNRQEIGLESLKEYIDYLRVTFPQVRGVIDQELAGFHVSLVVNMARDRADISLGASIKSLLLKYLGIPSRFCGYIEYDDAIWRSVRERRLFAPSYFASRVFRQVEKTAENVARDEEILDG